ncbi:MAG: DNA repair protein RecO [Candidatus Staskawiczbacteria bacterium]|nr:DNA repair protein RecO [Candidatus Staskawiczbacteria bacterium]
MAEKYRTKGFIFRTEERAEADRIFNVFSEDFGKINVHAKAIRKINSKLRCGANLFYLSEIEFIEGKNHKTLTDAAVINRFYDIFCSVEKIKTAYQISDILCNFIKGQGEDKHLFGLLQETFNKLNSKISAAQNQEMIYYYFLWNFLAGQGYKPEVLKCAACQSKLNPYNIYFSYKEGGVICGACFTNNESAQKINSDTVKILRIILNNDWHIFSKLKIEENSLQLFKNISDKAVFEFAPANA